MPLHSSSSVKELLIVANTPSSNTQTLADAVLVGAQHPEVSGVTARLLDASDANADHVLQCDAIIVGTTENFGYMSGLIKDFFERIYYPVLEQKQGLPYSLYVRAGLDGTGTQIGVEKIIAGLGWKKSRENLLLHGDYSSEFVPRCEDLGTHMAAGLEAGIF